MARTLKCRPRLDRWLEDLFYCPSCTTIRTSKPPKPAISNTTTSNSRRHASTLTSSTAINATKNVPKQSAPLYTALAEVKQKASAHVNLSRLQLAIQGLESTTPVTRIAVLGLNVQNTARRLVRLLLADALESEAGWERELARPDAIYTQGLLIRYGHAPNSSLPQQRTAIPVLNIPAPLLERSNVEILISSVAAPIPQEYTQGVQQTPSDTFLAPIIETPTAASGRQTVITQPVHSSILVAKGFDDLMSIAELLAATKFASAEDRRSVNVVVELPDANLGRDGRIIATNPQLAEEGLAAIRRSVQEASTYSHKWSNSGMLLLSDLFAQSSSYDASRPVPASVQRLISSVLASASSNIAAQAIVDAQPSTQENLNIAAKTSLESAIDEFSRNAHDELQAGLASAWSSRNWKKLAWYKLFWRVDDVGLITSDLITNAWLPRTERAVYELSGRLVQAGISPMDAPAEMPVSTLEPTEDVVVEPAYNPVVVQTQLAAAEALVTAPAITNPAGEATISMQPIPQAVPISATISQTRNAQINNAIASLTSQAQQLVLRTVSISGLSAGLSGLTYVSLTPGSFYEAGTIVAVGTAFALWRMQGGWMHATKTLERGLFDAGRDTIVKVVDKMRALVDQKFIQETRFESVEAKSLREARTAIEKAQSELLKL